MKIKRHTSDVPSSIETREAPVTDTPPLPQSGEMHPNFFSLESHLTSDFKNVWFVHYLDL